MTDETILINQDMDTPQANPLKAEEKIPEKSLNTPKTGIIGKLKTPKQKLLVGLVLFWVVLLVFAAVISIVNQARKNLIKSPITPELVEPTSAPILNDNQIPQVWQDKFKPIEDSLKPYSDILPPTFDLKIGL